MIARVAILLVCCTASGVVGFNLGSHKDREMAYSEEGLLLLLAFDLDATVDTLEYLERGDVKTARSFLETDIKTDLATLQELLPNLESATYLDGAAKTKVKQAFERGTVYAQKQEQR